MQPEMRKNIHALFDRHGTIKRTVQLTDNGYIAVTESSDPAVAPALREHRHQMQARIKHGPMVRHWDPAFAEYVEHASDIEHTMEPTEKGLRMVVAGKTPDAAKVAQNHAKAVTDFATNGWEAHDRSHPPALTSTPPQTGHGCCGSGMRGKGCGRGKSRSTE